MTRRCCCTCSGSARRRTRSPRRAIGRGRRPISGRPSTTPNSCTRDRSSRISSPTCGSTFAASRTRSCASTGSTTSRTAGAPPWCSSSTPSAIPAAMRGYGELCWGITASDGPGEITRDGRWRRAAVLRLPRAGRARRPRRRHDRSLGRGRVAAVRAGDRAADDRALHPAAARRTSIRTASRRRSIRPSPIARCPAWLGVAVALRPQPGADRRDDRELPIGTGVAIDTRLSAHRRRTAGRRIHRRVAVSHGSAGRARVRSRRRVLFSDGRYTEMIAAAGLGYSAGGTSPSRGGVRTRPATTPVRTSFSATSRAARAGRRVFQPSGAAPESYDVSFAEARAEVLRRDGAIATRLEVIVSFGTRVAP